MANIPIYDRPRVPKSTRRIIYSIIFAIVMSILSILFWRTVL